MKDKQTKRIEALARLQKHITGLRAEHARLLASIKNPKPVVKTGHALADAKADILAAQNAQSRRSSLENVANGLARSEKEALQLQAIISRGQRY